MASKPGLADLKKLRKRAAESAAHAAQAPARGTLDRQAGKMAKTAMAPAQPLSPHDQALFRQTMRHVHPLKDTRRAILPPVPMAAKAILHGRRAAAQGVEPGQFLAVSDLFSPAPAATDPDSYLKPGLGPDVIKNLKRDKWPVEASLDLHGATLERARERLDQFLQSCLAHSVKCVRIVHGKGYGSKDGTPVLKEVVRRWLAQYDAILAYTECSEQNGGSGAVQALLKKPSEKG
ncbi:MAG: Smr/MutS family protein [Pusillimonas sp.]